MTGFAQRQSSWLAVAMLSVASCVAPGSTTGTGPQPLGQVIDVEGSEAFVEIAGQVTPAVQGQRIFEGDRFFTGRASRLTIAFSGGGYVELDENTDPRVFREAGCLAIRLFRLGRMFVQRQAACIATNANAVIQHSMVVYHIVQPDTLRITVIEGKVESLQPPGFAVTPGYRLDLQGGRALGGGAYQVTTGQVREEVQWTDYYQQYRPSLPGFDRPREDRADPRSRVRHARPPDTDRPR